MADDTNGQQNAQAADGGQSQADDKSSQQSKSPVDTAAAQAAGAHADPELRKTRRENQNLRTRLAELEAKAKEAEDAKLSETERLKKERDELTKEKESWAAERRDRDARDAVIEAASDEKIQARNPRAVYRLVKDDLEFDDKGRVSNLSAVLKQAKTDYPELFGRSVGSADAGAGSGQTGSAFDMNAEIRRRMGAH